MMDMIQLAPLVATEWIIAFGLIATITALLRIRQSVLGATLRLCAIAAACGFLLGPKLADVNANPLPDIVLILTDESRSTNFGDRDAITTAVGDAVEENLVNLGVEVQRSSFGSMVDTELTSALTSALATVPRAQFSAVVVVSDGQIHGDIPASVGAPVHGLIIGDPRDQRDRRIQIENAPRFGVVGETVSLTLTLEALNEQGAVPTTLYVGGETLAQQSLTIGEEVTVTVPLRQPGETVIELEVAPAPGELTNLNNRAVMSLTAVRDRLRVLLVSGEPHAGERVWRNILKSDPAVDLVHFTILKPGTKAAVASAEELNLIAFPHEELFLEKLESFDVVIFDRYTYRGVLQSFEFDALARYVEDGGAILIAGGPEMSTPDSLAARPNLNYILPVLPVAGAVNGAFVPELTRAGERHPVTGELGEPENWGRWLRHIPGTVREGQTLMTTTDGSPLLVVDRVEDGRIAVLMSDHIWLWAREFDGGGPHQELLRRLLHWLMQEPELEEEALTADISREVLTVERRSLAPLLPSVRVEAPDGTFFDVEMTETRAGVFQGQAPAATPGLYRLSTTTPDGDALYALASDDGIAVPELGAVESTTLRLRPLAERSGGGMYTVRNAQDAPPPLRRTRARAAADGANWMGIPRRGARDIEAIALRPLLPNVLWALLIGGLIISAWLAEGRRTGRSKP